MRDAAALQHDRFCTQRQRDFGMLLDQDEGGALVGSHASDRTGQLFHYDRSKPFERLVEQ